MERDVDRFSQATAEGQILRFAGSLGRARYGKAVAIVVLSVGLLLGIALFVSILMI